MPKILPKNSADWRYTPLPENDVEHPYNVVITSVKWSPVKKYLRCYYNILDGDYENVYEGIQGFHNSFIIKDANGLAQVRLHALEKSNPGFDATAAFESDNWPAFVGKIVGVTYKLKKPYKLRDREDVEPELMQDSVVPIDYEWPAPVLSAPAVPDIPDDWTFDPASGMPLGYVHEGPFDDDIDTLDNDSDERVMYVDSRQHDGKHDEKHQALRDMGYSLVTRTLDTGDYIIPDGNGALNNRVVDTKHGIGELADNLSARDRDRFIAEMERATTRGLQMLILVTEENPIRSESDIRRWKPQQCRSCRRCDPHVRTEMCHKTGSTKPLCGGPLFAAIKTNIVNRGGMLRFVRTEEQAAEVISDWLEGRC